MAKLEHAVAENVLPGLFFVDDTCIDCGACRALAFPFFQPGQSTAYVAKQPTVPSEINKCLTAQYSCPTNSIGRSSDEKAKESNDLREFARVVRGSFPKAMPEIHSDLFCCGYTQKETYGALSWVLKTAAGNILIDVPRKVPALIKNIESMGGLELVFLTHRDDLNGYEYFVKHFNSKYTIHELDHPPKASDVLEFYIPLDSKEITSWVNDRDVFFIPVPGHTKGSVCLYYKGLLFTGDHLAWSNAKNRLVAFRDACWHSWSAQLLSMRNLAAFCEKNPVRAILPGHGGFRIFDPNQFQNELAQLLDWMKSKS